MIEKVYGIAAMDAKSVKKVIIDENIHYIHMVFPMGEGLPEHHSNANVYMTVLHGRLSIGLGDQDMHQCHQLKHQKGLRTSVARWSV